MGVRRLWGRRSADVDETVRERGPQPTPERRASPTRDGDRPREALAFALRSWGQFAIEIGDEDELAAARERFERLADSVLGAEVEAPPADYDGLERFVSEHRRGEQRAVGKRMGDLQEALWTFVECFHRSLSNDQRDDARAAGQLERLRAAINAPNGGGLRREALSTLRVLQSSIDGRKDRYSRQVELLSNKVTRLSEALVQAQQQAATDPLTGLANRAAFDEHLGQMAQIGPLFATRPVLMLMDVDHFKWVNDRFGHDIGDEVMRRTAARLRAELRARHDFVSRMGGDEFAAVLREVGPGQELLVADRVLLAIREMGVEVEGETVRCSMSVGTARLEAGESPATWMRRADRALYEAKHRGRDRAVSAERMDADAAGGSAVPPRSELKGASPS